MDQNATIAHQAAVTALDNNFLVLAMYGITAASTAYSRYKIYKSYQEEGATAALKQLGIEVTYVAAGHAAGRVIARAGTIAYPCVKDAVIAVLDEAPALKLVLGDMAEQLIIAAEKINQTAVGQAVSKIEARIVEQEAELVAKLGIGGRTSLAWEKTLTSSVNQTGSAWVLRS